MTPLPACQIACRPQNTYLAATSTTTTAKTSSHVTRCSDSQKNYCVNGGECFTLEIMPGSTKFLCSSESDARLIQVTVLLPLGILIDSSFDDFELMPVIGELPLSIARDNILDNVLYTFLTKMITISHHKSLQSKAICSAALGTRGDMVMYTLMTQPEDTTHCGQPKAMKYLALRKHRKKLHDRLRQNLRNKRDNLASSARGRQISNLPLQDLQLINHCNGMTMQHAAEKETEITLSTSKNAISTHEPTTLTHISGQSWSNDWSNNVLSDTESVSMMSLAENSQGAIQGRRQQQRRESQSQLITLLQQQEVEKHVSQSSAWSKLRGRGWGQAAVPRLEEGDDIEHYLTTFKHLAEAYQWPEIEWALRLIPHLTGKGRAAKDTFDYKKVKEAILAKYKINEELYQQKFREPDIRPNKNPTEFNWRRRPRPVQGSSEALHCMGHRSREWRRRELVATRQDCSGSRGTSSPAPSAGRSRESGSRPGFSRIATDIAGPLERTQSGHRYIQESWVGSQEKKTSVLAFVLQMREKMEQATKLLRKNMEKVQQGQQTWHDKAARERSFSPGQQTMEEDDDVVGEFTPTSHNSASLDLSHLSLTQQQQLQVIVPPDLFQERPGATDLVEHDIRLKDSTPIRLDDLIERVGQARFITTLDLCKEYWQVPLSDATKPLTAFRMPQGLWQFTKMPYGLHRAPATFQRLMNQVLAGMETFAAAYLDDIVICSTSWQQDCHLAIVLGKIKEAGLTINPRKCAVAKQETQYLGYILGGGNIKTVQDKVEAIRARERPTTRKQVKSFLGLMDASHQGIGGVLLQGEGEERKPVAYISRKLFPRETRYSAVELGCLAIKWVINIFKYISAVTTPTRLSPVSHTSPVTPGSPPSEMSAPLSSLAISVPSVALSPYGEEERPLLLSNKCQPYKSLSRDEQKRTSVHYNHGHVAHSLPPSPLSTMENNYQITVITAAIHMVSASPEKLVNTNTTINNYSTKRGGITNGHVLHNVESSGDSILESQTEEPQGEHTPFLTTDSTTALLLRAMDSSRTNPASPNDDLQVKSSSATIKQDPVAV
eukprot:superscaffoldBa00000289_g3531